MKIPHALKSLWYGHWTIVADTGVHVYETCACGKRRIRVVVMGHQPIDRGWLETGKWTPRPRSGPSGASGVVKIKNGGES